MQPARAARKTAIHRLFDANEPAANEAIHHIDPNESGSENSDSDDEDEVEVESVSSIDDSDVELEMSNETESDSDRNHGWRRRDFSPNVSDFVDIDFPVPDHLNNAYEYFKLFIDDDMFRFISEQTNIYYFQSKSPSTLSTSPKEIEILFGIILKMGVVRLSNRKDYWSSQTYFEPIAIIKSYEP